MVKREEFVLKQTCVVSLCPDMRTHPLKQPELCFHKGAIYVLAKQTFLWNTFWNNLHTGNTQARHICLVSYINIIETNTRIIFQTI